MPLSTIFQLYGGGQIHRWGKLKYPEKMNPRHPGTDLDISVLGSGHFGTDLDISVLGTGQFGTWMKQYSLLTTIVWYLLIVNIFVLVVL